jgi:hypothetical protein
MADLQSRYASLRAHLAGFLDDMDNDERHVQLGVCWAHYTLGSLTLEQFDELRDLLGFTHDDLDRLGL